MLFIIGCFVYFQMHHPVQMKPADSEKRNGELYTGKCSFP